MKVFKSIMLIALLATYSCTSETALPATEVSFVLDGQTFTSRAKQNNYGIEITSSGLNELFIDIRVDKKGLLLFCTTPVIEGTFTHLNSIDGERGNRIGLCDEVDSTFCKSTGQCDETEFVFTVSRQQNNPDMLSGTFEGRVCNGQGQMVTITAGSFKNLKQFPL
ncbi:MAG: hypothetical protein Roseis2KO_30180 [Roseivirga sp.]